MRPLSDADLRALRALVVRRRQVVAMCAQEKTHLDWLQTELERLNRALQDRRRSHPRWSGQTDLLRSVPGVGPIVAALVDVMPLNRDSGQLRGQRRVWGGRASVH